MTENMHSAYHESEGLARFKSCTPVTPDATPELQHIAQNRHAWLDRIRDSFPFIVGGRLTTADIWPGVSLDFAVAAGQLFDRATPSVASWFARITA